MCEIPGNVHHSLEPRWVYETLGVIIRVVVLPAAPVTAVEIARYPSDADPDVARQIHRRNPTDLGQESEVARSCAVEA